MMYNVEAPTEPVLIELLNHPAIIRVKRVQQSGVWNCVFRDYPSYTRYDHCVGVYALLKRFGAGLEEQVAGLLHDISHTAFSHAGDYVFTRKTLKDSYQDDIHAWYLKTAGIDNVLQKHGISFESVLYKSGSCSMLEQELPDICADRLEYNLQGGLCEKILTPEDVDMILMDLSFSGGRWYFKTLAVAKKFAPVSLHLTQNVWGSPVAHCMSAFFVMALKRAIEIGLVSRDDMHFGVDNDIWEKLSASDDEKIKTYMAMTIKAPVLAFTQHCPGDSTITFSAKFRGIDPWVMTDAGLKRLTAIDSGFKTSFDLVAQKVACCQVGIPHSFLKQRELLEALRSS